MFRSLGLSDEEAQEKFGFLTDAFKYGAPPHGGMGLGLDRLVMIMLGGKSIRDVLAFPKVQNMSELMTECPAPVDQIQLDELHIELAKIKSKNLRPNHFRFSRGFFCLCNKSDWLWRGHLAKKKLLLFFRLRY